MGRYNNRRTQQAAEALKNTPARARFSKGPPKKNNNRKKDSSRSNDASNGKGGNSSQQQQQWRHGNSNQKQAVVDKMKRRIMDTSTSSTTTKAPVTASIEQALDKADITKYDELVLSDHVLNVITNLLTDLGIVNHGTISKKKKTQVEQVKKAANIQAEPQDSLETQVGQLQLQEQQEQQQSESMMVNSKSSDRAGFHSTNQYTEQEDDVEEDDDYYDTPIRLTGVDDGGYDWEGTADDIAAEVGQEVDFQDGDQEEGGAASDDQGEDFDDEERIEGDDPYSDLRKDPSFLHLTATRYSYQRCLLPRETG